MIFEIGEIELDTGRMELRRAGTAQPVEPQVFDLLVLLIENRGRVVTKDEIFGTIWTGRIVSDVTLSSRINAARRAIGDDGKTQRCIKTVPRRGFRFVGEVVVSDPDTESEAPTVEQARARDTAVGAIRAPGLRQEVRFHTTADGACLAYSSMGDGPVLLKAANWMNHLEYEVGHPPYHALWEALSDRCRLIRYDQRGNGLSDGDLVGATFETLVDDLESLVDGIGLERFALFGMSQGCGVSVAYAVRRPERVSCLVLYGGYVKGWRLRGAKEHERGEAFNTLIEQGWGEANAAYRQLFASMFMPDASPEQMAGFNELQRVAVSAQNAMRLHSLFGSLDVSTRLAGVTTPTLVMHCEDDARAPFGQGRMMAAGIPGSRFVSLPGRNHLLQPQDPAWPRFLDELFGFVEEHRDDSR